MPFPNIYGPDQIEILRTALDEHCAANGIISPDDREDVALRLMSLFVGGATTVEALQAGLDADHSVRAAE